MKTDKSGSKDIILKVVNETKHEINNFRNKINDKGKELPDIKAIAKSLNGIEKVVTDIKKLCSEESKVLELIIQNLKYAQIKELLDKKDIMFDVINDNLPNGMELKELEEDEVQFSEKTRELWYEYKKVGKIEIIDESSETLYVGVTVNDSFDKFEVMIPNRMYQIISFINTKFNYE